MRSIPVFYSPKQVAPSQSGSPSPEKPRHVVQSWLDGKFPVAIREPYALTAEAIAIAHDRDYVEKVLALKEPNGFGTLHPAVAKALPYSVGSFLDAAMEALRNGDVACSPTSGFHHAGYDFGGGYCTFNGLMVAARHLLKHGVDKVGILDFDAHNGNGTTDIIEHFGLEKQVAHYTRGDYAYKHGNPKDRGTTYLLAEKFLDSIEPVIRVWADAGCEIILFQAGADPHINDPLGGAFLTSEQMERRDTIVFETCKSLGIPVAWNLAGGYQEDEKLPMPARIRPVLDIHDATMRACAKVHVE